MATTEDPPIDRDQAASTTSTATALTAIYGDLRIDQIEARMSEAPSLEIGAGVEAGAGDHDDLGTGAGGVAGARNEKRALYQLSEAGISATLTVRMIKYSVLELDG